MTVVNPDSTPVLGNTKVQAVLSIATPTAPSLATEINAATSVDASCYLLAAGWNPTATTNKGTRAPRLCTRTQVEAINRTTYQLADLQYICDPQADDTDPANELKALLDEGIEVYFVERLGLDARDEAWTAGQRVRVHHVVLGPQVVSGDRSDENAEFYIMQAVAYVGSGPVDGVIAA